MLNTRLNKSQPAPPRLENEEQDMHQDTRSPLAGRALQPPGDAFPELVRVNYFHGQYLGAREFRAEQAYVRAKLRLMNRCLHGYGVVCGLEVTPEPPPEPDCIDPREQACLKLAQAIAAAGAGCPHGQRGGPPARRDAARGTAPGL